MTGSWLREGIAQFMNALTFKRQREFFCYLAAESSIHSHDFRRIARHSLCSSVSLFAPT
jgi:hypothetical protein